MSLSFNPDLLDAASDETRAAVDRFIESALDEASYILQNGTPEVKAALFKSIMPLLQRRLEGESESEQLSKVKAAQNALMAELRDSLIPSRKFAAPDLPIPEDTDIPEEPKSRPSRARKKADVK